MANKQNLENALREAMQAADAGDKEAERVADMLAAELRSMPEQDKVYSLMGLISNIPKSGGKVVQDMLSIVQNPGDTVKALGMAIEAATEYANPAYLFSDEPRPHAKVAEEIGRAMGERYGSIDAAIDTMYEDPVGFLMDLSAATSMAGKAISIAPGAQRAAGMVQATGRAIDPVNLALNPAKAIVGKITPKGRPAAMYQGAAKFPPGTVRRPERERIIDAALRHGIMPTDRGINKLTGIIDDLDDQISQMIMAADASGKKIHRYRIYSELKQLHKELSKGAGAPKNLKTKRSIMENLERFLSKGPDTWKPSDFQEFKVKTYRDIDWHATKPGAKARATDETYMALAKGARKAIEDVTPEIAEVNRQYGPLADLRNRLPQVASRIENRNPVSLPTVGAAAAGAAAGGDVMSAVQGAGLGVLMNNPKLQAAMAIKLRQLQDAGVFGNLAAGSDTAAILRQGLFQAGRLEDMGYE